MHKYLCTLKTEYIKNKKKDFFLVIYIFLVYMVISCCFYNTVYFVDINVKSQQGINWNLHIFYEFSPEKCNESGLINSELLID